jgi:5-methylcytosine-specific restriction enzyme A
MPLAPTPCAYRGCQELAVYKSKCRAHQPPPWLGSNRQDRLPKDWATRRQIIMKQHEGVCHLCGGRGADAVDHVIAGDDHSLENLRPVHERIAPYCHRYKSSAEGNAARKKKISGEPKQGIYRPLR